MARRKFFSAIVALPADTATSVLDLMAGSIADWCGANSPHDSVIGSQLGLIPDGTVYVGHDSAVRNADDAIATPPEYEGVEVAASENYSLSDPGMRGTIDPAHVYLYSVGGANIEITFQGA